MIKVKGIAFTGYPISDVPRARKFYEDILGLKVSLLVQPHPGVWWIEYDIGCGTLGISNAWPPSGQSGPNIALEVEDAQAALADLRANQVAFATEIMESPHCHFFVIRDPDGNGIMIHQCKTS